MRMYKTILVVVLGATFWALTFAGPALAETGSGYVTWGDVDSLPDQGTAPHGGYKTNTVKCAVCHAVHQANGGGSEILLRSSVAEACTYCHVEFFLSTKRVYVNDKTKYQGENAYGHQTAGTSDSVECRSCHQVHAADELMPDSTYLRQKLLVGGDTQVGFDPEYDPRFLTAPSTGDGKDLGLTKWCTRCHKAKIGDPDGYGYYSADYDDVTHVMKAPTVGGYGRHSLEGSTAAVAWASSEFCQSCHSKGYGTSNWPHYVTSKRFLTSAVASGSPSLDITGTTPTRMDGVCLRCHRDNTGSYGVGRNF